jgi:hypothetical protein
MALTLRTAPGRTTPLSNIELDANFTYLQDQVNLRLAVTDYTYVTILSRLNGAPSGSKGAGSGLDVAYLQGAAPSTAYSAGTASIALRDGNGNFSANVITASLTGKSTTSGTADQANKLTNAITINGVPFDGSSNVTIVDKTKLPINNIVTAGNFIVDLTYIILEIGTTNWASIGASSVVVGATFIATGPGSGTGKAAVVSTGKLTNKASTTDLASFNILPGVAPSNPINGDLWSTSTGLYNRVASATRQVAYIDSNISGNASNVSGVVAIANGGTGRTTIADAREALDLAKRGVNSDITSLTGLTTALSTAQGGTGLTAPGANKNILISNGTIWTSAAPSGTWDIAISGEAATSAKAKVSDTRNVTTTPNSFINTGVFFDFKANEKETLTDGGSFFGEMTFRKYGNDDDWTGGKAHQLGFTDNNNLHIRSGTVNTWGTWAKLLSSTNYNDYAPQKDGTGATGSWPISITGSAGSAGTAGSASQLTNSRTINGVAFNGTANITIADDTKLSLSGGVLTGRVAQSQSGFTGASKSNIKDRLDSGFWHTANPTVENGWPVGGPNSGGGTSYYHLLSSTHSDPDNYYSMQFSADYYSQSLYYRSTNGDGAMSWSKILHSGNYTDYAPSKTGTGASGDWAINITGNAATASSSSGNAATATKLATARKINNVAFDGTQDITISIPTSAIASDVYEWAKASTKPSYAYSELTGSPPTFNQNTTGNAATATKLATARTINGVSFDGGADINIPIPTSALASDVYAWAKASIKPSYNYDEIGGTKPSYAYSELTGTKPSYAYSELTGTAPTFNQDTTGTAANATKWGGSKKYVQSTAPTDAVVGDIWIVI